MARDTEGRVYGAPTGKVEPVPADARGTLPVTRPPLRAWTRDRARDSAEPAPPAPRRPLPRRGRVVPAPAAGCLRDPEGTRSRPRPDAWQAVLGAARPVRPPAEP